MALAAIMCSSGFLAGVREILRCLLFASSFSCEDMETASRTSESLMSGSGDYIGMAEKAKDALTLLRALLCAISTMK